MRYRDFEIQPGYVEDARPCTMEVSHAEGFPNVADAMEHLRVTLGKWVERLENERNSCCRKAPPGFKFCSECGRPLAQKEPSPYQVQELFFSLFMTTCDELSGSGLYDHLEQEGWVLGTLSPEGGDGPPVYVEAVGRWMGRDEDEKPYMGWKLPDGTHGSTFDKVSE